MSKILYLKTHLSTNQKNRLSDVVSTWEQGMYLIDGCTVYVLRIKDNMSPSLETFLDLLITTHKPPKSYQKLIESFPPHSVVDTDLSCHDTD